MKNGEVIELFEGLEKLAQDPDIKFKTKVAYVIARNRDKIRSAANTIYNLRQKIISEYGVIEPNGDVTIAKDKISLVNQEIDELMNLESDVEIRKVKIEDLDDIELSLENMRGLVHMLEGDEPDELDIIKTQE